MQQIKEMNDSQTSQAELQEAQEFSNNIGKLFYFSEFSKITSTSWTLPVNPYRHTHTADPLDGVASVDVDDNGKGDPAVFSFLWRWKEIHCGS